MDAWEVEARAEIAALVTAYNALGDRGRFDELLALFADDATMDIGDGATYEGRGSIEQIFTGTRDSVRENSGPSFLQHHTSPIHVSFEDDGHAYGDAYFTVMSDRGIDHWGRYHDTYLRIADAWRFGSRRVRVDGRTPGGWADRRLGS
ncbi:MAG: nuclear transport factor 2 family protein [Actinomycetota bacterium]|nr:nuclear transport factor 2 family protein [Actinomycetota bacterium]